MDMGCSNTFIPGMLKHVLIITSLMNTSASSALSITISNIFARGLSEPSLFIVRYVDGSGICIWIRNRKIQNYVQTE